MKLEDIKICWVLDLLMLMLGSTISDKRPIEIDKTSVARALHDVFIDLCETEHKSPYEMFFELVEFAHSKKAKDHIALSRRID